LNKFKKTAVFCIFIALFFINPLSIYSEELKEETLLPEIIYSGLVKWHFNDIRINNEFSEKVFKSFLNRVDTNKQFLLQSDIDALKLYLHEIDDQIKNKDYSFMKKVQTILRERLQTVKTIAKKILTRGFDYQKDEYFQLSNEKRKYARDMKILTEYWRKILKYQALMRQVNLIKANQKSSKKKNRKEIKKAVITSLKKSIKTYFSNQEKKFRIDMFHDYINSIMNSFDPHTTYFPPKEQEDFNISMTGSFEGIGALLGERDGFVSIERIIPGGPCWVQKKLEAGDLILKVASKGKEPIDISGYRPIDAVKLIRGEKNSTVILTVKKPNGQIKEVSIIRGVVVVEESFVKSATYSHKKINKTIGYIFLPQFYRDFKNINGRDSFTDLKKELIKLNKIDVDGLILDLRWNSGGALLDAVKIGGLFIDKGPIVQVKGRRGDPKVLFDDEPGKVFDKPLIILVNSISASAAEILAGAMQDYSRAIIVGNGKTFGKGTVQTMIDIGNLIRRNPGNKKLGAIKFTIQKFYRITGSSNQSKGVTPDIILAHHLDSLKYGETSYEYYIAWDKISATQFKQDKMVDKNILKELSNKSNVRLAKDKEFQKVLLSIKELKKQLAKPDLSLNLKKTLKEQEKLSRISEKTKQKDLDDVAVHSTGNNESTGNRSADLVKIDLEKEQLFFKGIKKDVYIKECAFILNDWLNILSKRKNPEMIK
jgi:carboxyl-terminal processing protease